MKKRMIAGGAALLTLWGLVVMAADTKYDTSGNTDAASVVFGPKPGEQMVSSLITSCDKALGTAKFYGRAGNKYAPAANAASGATNVFITNTGIDVTNGDYVVYVHNDGTLDLLTCVASSLTNAAFSSGITLVGTNGDYVYDLTQLGQMTLADNSAGPGTNKLAQITGDVFAVPGDSPLYVTLESMTNSSLSVTVK